MSRIVAGRARGRRLTMPAGAATRPTTDRVKEAAFNAITSWLGATGDPDEALAGLSFLDLYAGSGAIALEAASRGADPVAAVEADARAAVLARRNATDAGLAVEVATARVDAFLAHAPRAFDLVWLDPPYELDNSRVEAVLERVTHGWLATDGLVIVERSTRTRAFEWPESLRDTWIRRYGETTLHFGSGGET